MVEEKPDVQEPVIERVSGEDVHNEEPVNHRPETPSTGNPTSDDDSTNPTTPSSQQAVASVAGETTPVASKPAQRVAGPVLPVLPKVLQVLIFCTPFFRFLDQVSKRAIHNFKSETPLIDAMILFLKEFPVIDSAKTVEQLRMRLKEGELEQYGEPFTPDFVYNAINRLPRFSSMRRGHQQDAEEFLGFLLEGLHDECVLAMRYSTSNSNFAAPTSGLSSPITEAGGTPGPASAKENGWLEVGPKQKAAVTRSSGTIVTGSPVTKIFGGNLRSELRVPGLKDSVTLEPYQPLQLDIGASNVNNIVDALKGLTRSEALHGDFKSPKGPNVVATKQVFIETLPPVLILHLKRFQYDNAGGTQKIWKKVGYPLDEEDPKVLAAALDGQKKDGVSGNGFAAIDGAVEDADQDGWKQASGTGKKWSAVATGAPAPKAKSDRFSIKDNKVAYLLFYQKI
ncbi:putative ubiquitin carboxyl-terminal hydrolase 10 [Diplocarpon rosae]|nr:putative ubiquitin carboxyl-terminal hydrolase 10 [Diplocarpon rosae]